MTQQEFTARYSYDPKSDQLGSGGFGSVYKAYDNEDDCFVALKIAAVDLQHPELRLRNEVAKAEHLKHKNVARYDACYTFETLSGEIDVAVMRYYEHGSLDGFMRKGSLTLDERYDILTQILEGIAYLHSHGIIHRDLKPQNVLIVHHAGRYIPKITDFGISKQLEDGESSLVSNSVLGGTRSYASPEQLCERALRKNTDLWSFGVIAYNMLLGELPFTTGTFSSSSDEGRSEQLRQVLSGVLPDGINHISEPWQSVIRGCLVVDGEKRLQHAEDCFEIINSKETPEAEVVVEPAEDEKTTIGDSAQAIAERTITDDVPSEHHALPTPESKSHPDPEPKPKGSRWWVWLLVVLAVGGVLFVLGKKNKENIKSTESIYSVIDSVYNIDSEDGEDSVVESPYTSAPYKVGDYYNENDKQGVVFEVSADGRSGKIVSLDQTNTYWDDANVWCREKDSDWYLPAIEELETIHKNKSTINSTLAKHGGTELSGWYWSSTEYGSGAGFYAWRVDMYYGNTYYDYKRDRNYVRAVSAF